MLKRYFYLIILLLIAINSPAFGVISMEIESQDQLRPFININSDSYPNFLIRIRITKDGKYIEPTRDNLLIIENNTAAKPNEIKLVGNSWYDVKWTTRLRGMVSTAFLLAFDDVDVRVAQLFHGNVNLAQIRIRSSDNFNLLDLDFGIVNANETVSKVLRMFMLKGLTKIGTTDEELIPVDSITTETPYFTWNWIGGIGGENPPPAEYFPGFNYNFTLRFQPDQLRYYTDKLTIHYHGGQKESVNLSANYYPIEAKSNLVLISPNGGEKLTPCQKIQIKWTGHDPNVIVFVEYSTNNGLTWQSIGNTIGDSLEWTVPAVYSESVKVRAKQLFQKELTNILYYNEFPVDKVAFNSNGSILASANQQAEIVEWDMADNSVSRIYKLDEIDFFSANYITLGLDYTKDDEYLAIGYFKQRGSAGRRDSFALINRATSEISRFALPVGYNARDIIVGPDGLQVAMIPSIGQEILIYDLPSFTIKQRIVLPSPISAFAYNKALNEASVAMYSGEVFLLDTKDFSIIKKFNFSYLPIILNLALSPNGKYMALGHQVSENELLLNNINEFNLVEIASGNVIRKYRDLSENAVGLEFNPISSVLLIGGQNNQQITFWDLINDSKRQLSDVHKNPMVDFDYSPAGSKIASCSQGITDDNIKLRSITFAEYDASDNFFSILDASLSISGFDAGSKLIGSNTQHVLTSSICNNGEVKVILESLSMDLSADFQLAEEITMPDTLLPGECLTVKMNFAPKDTGLLVDFLRFQSCMGTYDMRFSGRGLPRNISVLANPFDFGNVCVGDTVEQIFQIARNDDPIDLLVNGAVFQNPASVKFNVSDFVNDSIYPPNGIITAKVIFFPKQLGEVTGELRVFHSGQAKFFTSVKFKGTGIGPDYSLSNSNLRFIPEILTRKLTITNLDDKDINIREVKLTPNINFDYSANLPQLLPPGGKLDILITWNGIDDGNLEYLDIYAEPCAVIKRVSLGVYKAGSVVELPIVEADPSGEAEFDINFSTNAAIPYNGDRYFEATIRVNPRIFLPLEVVSQYGTGSIVTNEIINDERVFTIRIEGNLPESGIVGRVKGVAGLAEVDKAPLILSPDSEFWGQNVSVLPKNGEIRLINLCEDRRITRNSIPQLNYIAPNPSNGVARLSITAYHAQIIKLQVIDNMGNPVVDDFDVELSVGLQEIGINLGNVPSGTYRIVIKSNLGVNAHELIIVN